MERESVLSISNGITVKVVRDLNCLTQYADAWNKLALDAPQLLPMLSYAWVSSYLAHMLDAEETWSCFLAFDGERLIGVLPVIFTPHRFLGLSRPRARTPHNKHSFSVDFACVPDKRADATYALLSAILRTEPHLYDLALNQLPAISPTLAILNSNGNNGAITIKEDEGAGSYIKIEGSIENFYKNLSSNFSRNLSKARKKLARLSHVRAAFLSGKEITDEHIEQFMKVEASGWKGKAGTAILLSPKLRAFYTSLARALAKAGWMEIHLLEADGKVIAGHYAVRMGRTLNLLKIGYDENYAFCAPGNMLFEKTVERAFAERDTDEINCITDMAWHDNWKMLKRPYYNLWIYPRRPLPYIFGALRLMAKIEIRQLPLVPNFYRRLRDLVGKKTS